MPSFHWRMIERCFDFVFSFPFFLLVQYDGPRKRGSFDSIICLRDFRHFLSLWSATKDRFACYVHWCLWEKTFPLIKLECFRLDFFTNDKTDRFLHGWIPYWRATAETVANRIHRFSWRRTWLYRWWSNELVIHLIISIEGKVYYL